MATIKSLSSWLVDQTRSIANYILEASPFRVELIPIHHVEEVSNCGDAFEWAIAGDASSYNLAWKSQRPLLAARYRLTIDFPHGWHSLNLPQLYFDSGEGYNNRESIELQFIDGSKKKAANLVSLPRGALSLRLDRSITPAHMAIGKVELQRFPSLVYYWGVAIKLARSQLENPRQLVRSFLCVLRTLVRRGARGLARRFDQQAALLARKDYSHWVAEFDTLTASDRSMIAQHIESLPDTPVIVIWSLRAEDIEHIPAVIESLKYQLHQNWQAIVIVPTARHLGVALNAAKGDERIRVLTADFPPVLQPEQTTRATLLLAGKVVLRDHALYLFALEACKGATFVYADEDLLTDSGRRAKPFFKPNYSPELARNTPYFGSCILVQPVTLDILSAMKDVALSNIDFTHVTEVLSHQVFSNVAHIPFVLFSDNERCARASLQDRIVTLASEPLPKVSIIIPTRDREDLLRPCIESILKNTEYPRDQYEIIVIDNGSSKPSALRYLGHIESRQDVIILRDDGKFNYSRLNNRAVELATGDILIFLNNDTVVLDALWLHRFVFHAKTPDVGVVGGKLLFPDRTVQHGGVVMGVGGVAAHAHWGASDGGYENLCNLTHEVSAVTAACCAIRRSVFLEIGGFDENLAVAYNDILLCLDALHRGYRNIYIGTALIMHYQSKSRGPEDTPEKQDRHDKEATYARQRYPEIYKNDPYYNPNLSVAMPYEFAFPPRRIKPWRDFKRLKTRKLRILLLSATHEVGQKVSAVIAQQAIYLINAGHDVFIGGPDGNNEHSYENCKRLIIDGASQSAETACKLDIDCVISHTPPFYSTVRWLGPHIKSIIFEHGDATQKDFTNAKSWRIHREKQRSLSMADAVYNTASLDIENAARNNWQASVTQIVNIVENLCLSNATPTVPNTAKLTKIV